MFRRSSFPVRYLRREGGIVSSELRLTVHEDGRAERHRWAVGQEASVRIFYVNEVDLMATLRDRLQELSRNRPQVLFLAPYANACYDSLTFRDVEFVVLRPSATGLSMMTTVPSSPHDLAVVAEPKGPLTAGLELLQGLAQRDA